MCDPRQFTLPSGILVFHSLNGIYNRVGIIMMISERAGKMPLHIWDATNTRPLLVPVSSPKEMAKWYIHPGDEILKRASF